MTHPLKSYRERANLSAAELAAKVGTTRQTIHRIEKGDQNPSFDLMQRIAAATSNAITPNDFMGPRDAA
jgi:putative transcriptional regulator